MNFLKLIRDWLVSLFTIAFGLFFGLACVLLSLYVAYSTIFSATWTETTGQIDNSYAKRHSKGTSYKPQVFYTYQVNGTTYKGNVLSYDGSFLPSFASKETVEERLLLYQKNAIVKVYYNPLYPSQSCLERGGGLTMQFLTLLLGIVLIYVGFSEIGDLLKKKNEFPN